MSLLEADKGRATCTDSKKPVHEMVKQELNKPDRYKNVRTHTNKKSRSAINKKSCRTKIKRSNNKIRFHFKTKCSKTPKIRLISKIHKDPFKNV